MQSPLRKNPTAPSQRSFIREWASDPLRVAAIAPSSRRLAQIITSEIDPRSGPVIELGPGTGSFTRAILARGVDPDELALIELGAAFAERLRAEFPDVTVLNRSAAELDQIEPFDGLKAGAVVSGLGLLSMPQPVVEAILDGVLHHLAPGGAFYQFTYSWRCPIRPEHLARRGLTARQIGRTFRNLPPAQVYKITRQ